MAQDDREDAAASFSTLTTYTQAYRGNAVPDREEHDSSPEQSDDFSEQVNFTLIWFVKRITEQLAGRHPN